VAKELMFIIGPVNEERVDKNVSNPKKISKGGFRSFLLMFRRVYQPQA
jgi:hypothetical protein